MSIFLTIVILEICIVVGIIAEAYVLLRIGQFIAAKVVAWEHRNDVVVVT